MSFPGSRHVSPRTATVPTSSTKGAKARLVHGMWQRAPMRQMQRRLAIVGYAPSRGYVHNPRKKTANSRWAPTLSTYPATPAPANRTRATLHSATATGPLVTPHLPQPRQPPSTPPLTAHPSPEAAGKWPEDSSNPQVHGQHTGTRGMVHPTLCRVAHSTNPTNSVQKQYKNRPTTIQEPSNNRTTTRTHTVHPHRHPPARRSKGRA